MEDEQGRKDGTLTLTEGQISFALPKVDTVVMVPISIGQIYLEERPLTRIMCEDLLLQALPLHHLQLYCCCTNFSEPMNHYEVKVSLVYLHSFSSLTTLIAVGVFPLLILGLVSANTRALGC